MVPGDDRGARGRAGDAGGRGSQRRRYAPGHDPGHCRFVYGQARRSHPRRLHRHQARALSHDLHQAHADHAGHARGAAQVGERTVMTVTRREVVKATLAAVAAGALLPRASATAAAEELKMPDNVPATTFDFEAKGIEGWTTVDGQWAVEDMAGAPSGKKVLVQRATRNEFNVIVAPPGPYTDVDVSMKFKPISGREDASGGIVFRFNDSKYYVVRANALEDNFRLYYYDRGRRQLASASVKAPALGQWHTVRVVALGDHFQGWLNGKLLLEHRDTRFRSGRVGLWTKADSITAFDDLTIHGVTRGG